MTSEEMKKRAEYYRKCREEEKKSNNEHNANATSNIQYYNNEENHYTVVSPIDVALTTGICLIIMFFGMIFNDFIYIWAIVGAYYWKYITSIEIK